MVRRPCFRPGACSVLVPFTSFDADIDQILKSSIVGGGGWEGGGGGGLDKPSWGIRKGEE